MRLSVDIDEQSGFCFGVVRAISRVEQAISECGEVYTLGDIVHNRVEVQRLEQRGMKSVNHDTIPQLPPDTQLLIRAHGEPPSTYDAAKKNGLRLLDATCPVVARLQKVVKQAHEQMMQVGGQVILLGKRGHAEVVGLTGQVGDDVHVIEGVDDLDGVDFSHPIYLLSQTTQSISLFEEIAEIIKERACDPSQITINDTICRQVSSREEHLRQFAAQYDVVIFVSGRKSSNGKVLFGVCKEANAASYNVEEASEIDLKWFEGAKSVGVCGATSTPRWLMESVADFCRTVKF